MLHEYFSCEDDLSLVQRHRDNEYHTLASVSDGTFAVFSYMEQAVRLSGYRNEPTTSGKLSSVTMMGPASFTGRKAPFSRIRSASTSVASAVVSSANRHLQVSSYQTMALQRPSSLMSGNNSTSFGTATSPNARRSLCISAPVGLGLRYSISDTRSTATSKHSRVDYFHSTRFLSNLPLPSSEETLPYAVSGKNAPPDSSNSYDAASTLPLWPLSIRTGVVAIKLHSTVRMHSEFMCHITT